eukprot:288033-Chlamydomonas_euryale.AAC.2
MEEVRGGKALWQEDRRAFRKAGGRHCRAAGCAPSLSRRSSSRRKRFFRTVWSTFSTSPSPLALRSCGRGVWRHERCGRAGAGAHVRRCVKSGRGGDEGAQEEASHVSAAI